MFDSLADRPQGSRAKGSLAAIVQSRIQAGQVGSARYTYGNDSGNAYGNDSGTPGTGLGDGASVSQRSPASIRGDAVSLAQLCLENLRRRDEDGGELARGTDPERFKIMDAERFGLEPGRPKVKTGKKSAGKGKRAGGAQVSVSERDEESQLSGCQCVSERGKESQLSGTRVGKERNSISTEDGPGKRLRFGCG